MYFELPYVLKGSFIIIIKMIILEHFVIILEHDHNIFIGINKLNHLC